MPKNWNEEYTGGYRLGVPQDTRTMSSSELGAMLVEKARDNYLKRKKEEQEEKMMIGRKDLKMLTKMGLNPSEMSIDQVKITLDMIESGIVDPNYRIEKQEGGEAVEDQMAGAMKEKNTWAKTSIETKRRYGKQEGGEAVEGQMDDLMMMPEEEEMVPDEEMEDNYIDFIVGESLTPEDEEYLLTALEEDDRLSMIFDQVVETASEFAGSGPVEGPGTGMSDSIPARLSDGEFVMTAKATEKIGSENLQRMMDQAEVDADIDDVKRQIKQAGGLVTEEEEQEKIPSVIVEREQPLLLEEDPMKQKNKEAMRSLDPRLSLFAS